MPAGGAGGGAAFPGAERDFSLNYFHDSVSASLLFASLFVFVPLVFLSFTALTVFAPSSSISSPSRVPCSEYFSSNDLGYVYRLVTTSFVADQSMCGNQTTDQSNRDGSIDNDQPSDGVIFREEPPGFKGFRGACRFQGV